MSGFNFLMSNHPFFIISTEAREAFDITVRECCFSDVDNWFYPEAVFPCWVFYWNPEPGAELFSGGKVYPLQEDSCFLIPPYTKFSTKSFQPFRQFYLHFSVPEPFDRVLRKIFVFPAKTIGPQVKKILNCSDENRRALLIRCLVYVHLAGIPENDFLEPEEQIMSPGIRKAVESISEHLQTPLSNTDLCRKAGLSRNQFYELFRKEMGMTPGRYLLNMRMEHARRKLIYSNETIDEIAAGTGYADRFHFSKAFKKFYGFPPGSYRRPVKKV